MANLDAAVAQLRDELDDLATRLGAVLGTDLQLAITQRADERADTLVAELVDGDLGSETAADLLNLLWPHGDPDLGWWRTPLGLRLAPHWAAANADASWTYAAAAQVLGVSRGTALKEGSRGNLDRAPDGGVMVTSVIARLVRLASKGLEATADGT